jgi:signal transduction histidine kinase
LRRIYANLLSNAMKHTTTGGVITILAEALGGELLCTIHDDGEGIPADDIPNLFAAFEQSRLTLHGRFDTGMGLAFCKLAVEGHGGRIWVESERGHGASFYFAMPLGLETDDDDFADLLI